MASEQQAQIKQQQREQWSHAAEAWRANHDTFVAAAKHVTAALVVAADLKPGHHVLDLAGGTGEPALTVARHVAPEGTVICTDLVQGMLDAAEDNARAEGLSNISFEIADMEDLQFEDDRFDRVTSRFGIMFPPDTQRALGQIRRVLKPGGRAAFAVWGTAAENPNLSLINGPLIANGLMQPPPPGAPTPARFGEPGSLAGELRAAGFSTVHEEQRDVEWRFPGGPDDHLSFMSATLTNVRKALETAPAAVVDEIKTNMAKYQDGDALNYGARIHVAWAVK